MDTAPQIGYEHNSVALNPPLKPLLDDIGPFRRPIFNKLVRGTSAITSLIALILHFSILGQGLTIATRPAPTDNADQHEREAARATTSRRRPAPSSAPSRTSSTSSTSTRPTRTSRTSSSSTGAPTEAATELLGRALPTTRTIQTSFATPTSTPTRLAERMILKIRQNNRNEETETLTSTNAPPIFTYVPNTDIPARDGAIGFTAVSHLSAAVVILFLFWLEWLLFMKKPTFFSYWGPLIIAAVQLFMAFDILGRSIPVAAQAGGYVLLLMAVINMFLAGWTVLLARRKLASPPPPPPLPVQQVMDRPISQPLPFTDVAPAAPVQIDPLPAVDPNALPYMGEKQDVHIPEVQYNSQEENGWPQDGSHERKRRGSTGTRYTTDNESYHARSPTRRDRRRSYTYGSRGSQDYILPPSVPAIYNIPATSPISLYGPEESRRRIEQQRRSRRRSLVQPGMPFDPHTGTYVEPAGRFVQRSSQALHNVEEEEDDEIARIGQLNPGDPRSRQDGFANRTRVWKRLQSNSGII